MQPYEDNAICKFRTLMKVTKKSQTPKTPKNLKASFGYWVAINKINENRIFFIAPFGRPHDGRSKHAQS